MISTKHGGMIYKITKPNNGVPKGIRTLVTAVKGQCPRPLDDGDLELIYYNTTLLLTPNNGVPKGIRTPVTAVKGQCPRPLDDGDLYLTPPKTVVNDGGARRDRTADLLHAMQALSQLSYNPKMRIAV